MDRQTVEPGFAVRRPLGDAFTMGDPGGRLAFQRAIYLLRACGAYMGRPFTRRLRGPYCPALAAQGFGLRHICGEIPGEPVDFADRAARAPLKRFLGLARGKGAGDLEALASLHYARRNRPGLSAGEAKKAVQSKKGCPFTEGRASGMWRELEKRGLVA